MKTPVRAPDFNAIFRSEADFNAAHSRNDQISEQMLEHVEGLEAVPRSLEADYDKLPRAARGQWQLPRTFNSRRLGQSILTSLKSTIVPAAHGRIENLLITVPWYRQNGQIVMAPRYSRHYQSLINALGDNRAYTILCHPSHALEIKNWFSGRAGVKLDFCLSPVFEYSIWAQDAYVALSTPQAQAILAEGILFARYDDMTIADDVAAQSSIVSVQSNLYYQGGNVLGGPSYCLIGEDYIFRNETRVGFETRRKVLDAFEATFCHRVTPLGGHAIGKL